MDDDATNAPHTDPAAAHSISTVQSPPRTPLGILRRLGPGLIIAGSIVGSGELIATTLTGAEAGFWLLWLIVLGCVIKVFAQIEFGRYTIVNGRTAMEGMNEVPGPALGRSNWLLWYWLIMFLVSIGQLGGIVGGVGQALAISAPISVNNEQRSAYVDRQIKLKVNLAEQRARFERGELEQGDYERIVASTTSDIDRLTDQIALFPTPHDDKIWAAIVTVITAVLLVVGRYGMIQSFATAMVAMFTLVTVLNVIALQNYQDWAVRGSDLLDGFRFRLAAAGDDWQGPLMTAAAAFGIIGVGANELISYPYWCLERGYARFTGPREDSAAWADRARGWMRVMRWDAWCSMVIYTFATIAFYLLGAAVLGRSGLIPEKSEMVRTLRVMYEPVFGERAGWLFLFGAFAVLYSTFFVANAGHARVASDALRVIGLLGDDERSRRRWIAILSGVFPFMALAIYIFYPQPTRLVLAGGFMQFMMLPMLAGATLFFRYRRCDQRIAPGKTWDVFLWISAAGLVLTCAAGCGVKIWQLIEQAGGPS